MDYNKLKVDQLKKECDKREIVCKQTREEMIKALKLHDEDKWIFHTLQKNATKRLYFRTENEFIVLS